MLSPANDRSAGFKNLYIKLEKNPKISNYQPTRYLVACKRNDADICEIRLREDPNTGVEFSKHHLHCEGQASGQGGTFSVSEQADFCAGRWFYPSCYKEILLDPDNLR